MKKIAILVIVLTAVALIPVVVAFGGTGHKDSAIRSAIEANDFEAWKTVLISSITEEKFQKLVDRYNSGIKSHDGFKKGNYTKWTGDIKHGDYTAWHNFTGKKRFKHWQ